MRVACTVAHRGPWQALCRRECGTGDRECFLWWPQVHLVERARRDLLLTYRCLLHCHPVILVEGVRHHLGQLSPSLRPQVPAETVLPPQLLEAHFLSCKAAAGPPVSALSQEEVEFHAHELPQMDGAVMAAT